MKQLFPHLVGQWTGQCQLWLDPTQPPETTPIEGEYALLCGGRLIRHKYHGIANGKPHTGEETIYFNEFQQQVETYWIDDFHMNYAVMVSKGPSTPNGFNVRGQYEIGGGHPNWGWRTVLEFLDQNHLRQTAYNITPDGDEAIAIQIDYDSR